MAATHMDDIEAVHRLVQLYIDGASGDAAKLREAFHPQAMMFGHINGRDMTTPIEGFIKRVEGAKGPLAGPNYRARVINIDLAGDAGVATLAEEDYLGCNFVDWFSVARIDEHWKIVNKTFACTGGKLPG